MVGWTCPRCDRQFGRTNQSHSCVPATTVDAWFAGRPPWQREAFDRMEAHLRSLGPLVTEAVEVGVFFKKSRTFAEVRRRRDGLSLEMLLSRRLTSPRVGKVLGLPGRRAAHFFVLRGVDDVDAEILDWLAEAYDASPE